MSLIPVNEPLTDGNEEKYLVDCARTGWVSSAGKYIERFEKEWAAYCGMGHGVAVTNGTAALELAMQVLELPSGSEVILPSFTIISCAQAVIKAGCVPVLVDCDPETWCMDPELAAAAITERTRAIMPVHIYGHPVDMDPILALAKYHDLVVIEDAAEVHGAEYKGKKCGGLGDMSCFSFYANKIITTGEGGMVLVNDRSLEDKLRYYLNLCFMPSKRFLHEDMGSNLRLTNLQAAVGVAQLERIEFFVEKKRKMAARYNQGLAGLPVQLPVERDWAKNVYWMYGLVLDEDTGMDATDLAKRLSEHEVQTRPFFLGMHEQPVFHEMGLFRDLSLPVTERIARQGLYLPSGQALTEEQMDRVIQAMQRVLG